MVLTAPRGFLALSAVAVVAFEVAFPSVAHCWWISGLLVLYLYLVVSPVVYSTEKLTVLEKVVALILKKERRRGNGKGRRSIPRSGTLNHLCICF